MAGDDQQWRSLLRGAPVPEAREALCAEAQRLRGAIAERFEAERAALREAGFDAEGLWARIRQTGREQRVFDGGAQRPPSAAPCWWA